MRSDWGGGGIDCNKRFFSSLSLSLSLPVCVFWGVGKFDWAWTVGARAVRGLLLVKKDSCRELVVREAKSKNISHPLFTLTFFSVFVLAPLWVPLWVALPLPLPLPLPHQQSRASHSSSSHRQITQQRSGAKISFITRDFYWGEHSHDAQLMLAQGHRIA